MSASSASPSGNVSSFAPRIPLIEDEPQITAEIIGLLKRSDSNIAVGANWPADFLTALGFEAQPGVLDTFSPGLSSRAAMDVFHPAPDSGPRLRRMPFLYSVNRRHTFAQRFDHHPELPTAEYIFKLIATEIPHNCVQRRLQKTLFPGAA